MHTITRYQYPPFGQVEMEATVDYTKQTEKLWIPFQEVCVQIDNIQLPLNFTKFIYDLWDEQSNTLVYASELNYTMGNLIPYYVFHTRRIFSSVVKRIFFFFSQDSGELEYMWFEDEPVIIRALSGMERFTFDDSDFSVECKQDPTPLNSGINERPKSHRSDQVMKSFYKVAKALTENIQ